MPLWRAGVANDAAAELFHLPDQEPAGSGLRLDAGHANADLDVSGNAYSGAS
jgi:hypothetical protein